MNSKKELLKKITSKVIEDIIDTDFYEWPPSCSTIFFQPIKPATVSKTTPFESNIEK